ncbi:TetR/AcrR family transcriptional regulator [Streptomyces sp. GQFP]|uniref:TetR/AcrR family transcriptional regulator n=1 Tax=Streptomyces sp. GQFP TaxID=2907545 RepID=UPI001F416EB0|nr:TetR/AcrR family transcriptional regulator [Streptomyces sp. GQFP]UIX31983.1 TetR/AcrR family transcriptional regulator [Streptomyces sp. GQFP]
MPVLDETRRERVLGAVVACFARYGYRRTSMDLLAQAADMSRPALYQYFRNKEEVFRAAVDWSLDRTARHAEGAACSTAPTEERVRAILDAVLDLYTGNPVTGEHFHELLDEVYSRTADLWAAFEKRTLAALRAVLDSDAKGPADISTEDAAIVLFYGAKGIGIEARSVQTRVEHVHQLATLVLRGLSRDTHPDKYRL